MKNGIATLIAVATAACASAALAQDPAQPLPAPGTDVSSAPQPTPEPGPPAPAPAPKCAAVTAPADVALYADAMAEASLRARRLDRLEAIVAREGGPFSREKYDAYRNEQAAGVLLVVLGGASLFSALVSGVTLAVNEPSSSCDDEYDDCYGDDEGDGSPLLPGLPLGFLFGGIGALAIGIPLTAHGTRGKRRQELLYRKGELLASAARPDARLSLFADPEGRSGGLRLEVTF